MSATLEFDDNGNLTNIKFEGFQGETCKAAMLKIIKQLASRGIKVDVKNFIPHEVQTIRQREKVKL